MSRGTYGRTSQKDIAQDARRLKPFMAASGGDTYRVRVSANDTTPNYLEEKLVSADTSVVITATNDGADEDLDLSVAVYVAAEIADHAADPDAHHNQVHVLADTTGLGPDHTTSGLTAGQVLRATGATTAAFASLQATDLPAHVLATNLALGSQHTISGATAGHVLRASSATAAAFAQLQHGDLGGVGSDDHHAQAHELASTSGLGADHTVAGLTDGQVLQATGATTAVFAALDHDNLTNVTANQHHNQSHVLADTTGLGPDHTTSGLTARQVLIATGATTALFRALVAADLPTGQTLSVSSANSGDSHAITSSNAVSSATAVLLATDANGRIQVQGIGVGTAAVGTGIASISTRIFINDTSDANVTRGIVINQGDADDIAISLKSSDVTQGATTRAEADNWGYIKKFVATGSEGGLLVEGLTEGDRALGLVGTVTSEDTSRSTAAVGAVEIRGHTVSGTGVITMGTNANILVVKNSTGTQFLVDAEGDIHMNATSNINAWDDEDDMALINGLRGSLVPQLRERYGDLVRQMRPVLEAGNIVTFNDQPGGDGSVFLNLPNAILLTMDGLRQVYGRVDSRLSAIERRFLDA